MTPEREEAIRNSFAVKGWQRNLPNAYAVREVLKALDAARAREQQLRKGLEAILSATVMEDIQYIPKAGVVLQEIARATLEKHPD